MFTAADILRQADQIKKPRLEMEAELNSLSRLVVGEFQCDGCEEIFSDEQPIEVDGPGGWTMCAVCAAKHNEPNEWPSVMDHAEFPFADNH